LRRSLILTAEEKLILKVRRRIDHRVDERLIQQERRD
jgi:hypothetical protein